MQKKAHLIRWSWCQAPIFAELGQFDLSPHDHSIQKLTEQEFLDPDQQW